MAELQDALASRLQGIQSIAKLTDGEIAHLLNHVQVGHKVLEVDGEKYPAWRIVHNRALGPGKGGIRFHPGVSEDEVRALSFWMSLKNSLSGLPFGGAKGGITFNPKEKTPAQLEKISRAYVRAFADKLGQDKDIPAPDVYTNGQIMAWMLDEFETIVGHHEPGMITGKPVALQGIPLRGAATAQGGVIVIEQLVKELVKKENYELTVAVQGFGNAGAHVAHILAEKGFKLVAASDSKGGVFNEMGLDPKELDVVKKEHGTVGKLAKGKAVSNAELLELDVDILILAALENQVTTDNAKQVKAKYIIELANGPVTPEADALLFEQGTMVVPDILANSGGVVVSYFEWAQNRSGNLFEESYLERKLQEMMEASWSKVITAFHEHKEKIDLRSCAYIIAIDRILIAERLRGRVDK
jgi:glutamate dehydrogenase/leucine dehydrogenase